MTAQVSESLLYKGQEFSMRVNPLTDYFVLKRVWPSFQTRSTACWRCYVGSWEISLDRLYLVGINANYAEWIPRYR